MESGLTKLDKVDRIDLVLVSGKLVLQNGNYLSIQVKVDSNKTLKEYEKSHIAASFVGGCAGQVNCCSVAPLLL